MAIEISCEGQFATFNGGRVYMGKDSINPEASFRAQRPISLDFGNYGEGLGKGNIIVKNDIWMDLQTATDMRDALDYQIKQLEAFEAAQETATGGATEAADGTMIAPTPIADDEIPF